MKNNKNFKVAVNNANRDRSKFNLDHDVNTTASLGTLQPLAFWDMLPHDKMSLSHNSLVRSGTFVLPAWAKFKMKTWTQFVPITSVFPNYDYFVTGTKKSTSQANFIPTELPWITSAQLAQLCLIGADVSLWINGLGFSSEGVQDCYAKVTNDSTTSLKTIANQFKSNLSQFISDNATYIAPIGGSGYGLDVNRFYNHQNFFYQESANLPLWIPIKSSLDDVVFGNKDISPSNADFVIVSNINVGSDPFKTRSCCFCFKLSDTGKLLLKLFKGLGYRVDFSAHGHTDFTQRISLLPILAWYRAYFNVNGIERERAWEATNCHAIIHEITEYNKSAYGLPYSGNTATLPWNEPSGKFWYFLVTELINSLYAVDEYDFISSHRKSVTQPDAASYTSFSGTRVTNDIYTVNYALNNAFASSSDGGEIVTANGRVTTGNAFNINSSVIDSSTLGQTSVGYTLAANTGTAYSAAIIEALKRLSRVTNKQTVLGQNVRSLLKALGQGAYFDDSPVEFVGYREFDLNVSEVTATSDTYNSAQSSGRVLGEQAGKSVSSSTEDSNKSYADTLVYSTDCRGFFITMGGVMPVAGYVNMADSHHYMVKRSQQYEKEFEGLGYDCSRFERLFGDRHVSLPGESKDHAFGFVPRWSSLKFASNLNNGDFNRASRRDSVLPYTSDKIVRYDDVNGHVHEGRDVSTGTFYAYVSSFLPNWFSVSKLPVAGMDWAYVYKYGFMGYLNRMFVNYDSVPDSEFKTHSNTNAYCYEMEDNFIIHSRLNMSLESEMLPVEDTYQTQDDSARANQTLSIS